MTRFVSGFAAAAATMIVSAQAPAPSVSFKLGTFEHQGRTFVGLVLRDKTVIDVGAANAALEAKNPSWKKVQVPRDMIDVIAGYESAGLRARFHELAGAIKAEEHGAYSYDVKSIRILPPIRRPGTMLNVAVNYREHENEMAAPSGTATAPPAEMGKSVPGLWERKPDDTRHTPYLFLKPQAALTGDGAPIRIPQGRDRIDWECELAVVIGKEANHVPIERAKDYIFGYTLENDVSDRGGRGDARFGSDWLIGKGHDTFAPMGPFVVPAEFISDPQKLAIKFTLSGKLMQDSNTDRMIHTVYEQVAYGSNILTLRPGDVISTGSPAGVGSARNPPIFMKPGDVSVCTIEGIGTLTNPVVGPTGATTSSGKQP
jgi:2-keto-4-pentenoate hydratase/2-oxohepta-3-ene-1,7-dioic acid hydratase in catechol pathway